MTKTVIDRFKMIEIDQEHGSWPRIADITLGRQHDVLQERPAIGDAGDRIDHSGRSVMQLGALLRHGQQDERIQIVSSSASELSTVIQTLPNKLSPGEPGNSATIGVRSRNNAPWANSMKIAGQRDTKGSSRPRQNS